MHFTSSWLQSIGAEYLPAGGKFGCAHLSNYSVEYCEWGDGPPLVIVPGLAGGYPLLGRMVQFLSKNYRVISYQLRGENNSFTLRRPFGFDDLVEDLREFLDWHYLESPILFGVSFGGALALDLASRYPSRISKLVINGAGARFESSFLQRIAGSVLCRIPLPTDSPFINQFFNLLFGGKMKSGKLVRFVTQQCWKTDQCVMAHRFQMIESFDIADRLHNIKSPTLILAGDRDVLVSRGNTELLRRGIAKAQLRNFAGSGHLGFITHAEEMAQEINQFLPQSAN